jgi:hypothetical protein
MPRISTFTCLILAVLGVCAVTATQAQAAKKPPKLSDLMADYDLRISVQMKSSFAFQPKPNDCAGKYPMGWSGAGEEILEMRSPKPVRVTVFRAPGEVPGVGRKDLKAGFDLTGETRRSGQMTNVVCQDSIPNKTDGCTGKFPLTQKVQIQFQRDRWSIGTQSGPSTREAIPSCTDQNFDWDGAVARAGTTLLNGVVAPLDPRKLRSSSFTLEAREVADCGAEYFGIGTCKTEWVYKANFRQVKKSKKKRRG